MLTSLFCTNNQKELKLNFFFKLIIIIYTLKVFFILLDQNSIQEF
jgi:hypothetical protein